MTHGPEGEDVKRMPGPARLADSPDPSPVVAAMKPPSKQSLPAHWSARTRRQQTGCSLFERQQERPRYSGVQRGEFGFGLLRQVQKVGVGGPRGG